ncbi:hypothetical protein [Geminisphaera colitermitum]|uniref:hypothetical protein n=1 Tax=Geminisphaera colitermitum TaxID=1148786 RepID=UPI000158D2AE|nr:hypothetical protein [Geminisphaera colitermitum]
MTNRELFRIWAPADSVWSPWAKPVLFADMSANPPSSGQPFAVALPPPDPGVLAWLAAARSGRTAVVLDLPGVQTVERALQFAARGFRPVPLFNTTNGVNACVPVADLVRRLVDAGPVLTSLPQPFPPDAPPVFMLDANRNPSRAPSPGDYDNRWVVFPQDFPSADFLKRNGITAVLLWSDKPGAPRSGLDHVLVRWQDAGLALYEHIDDMLSVQTFASPPPAPDIASPRLPAILRVARPRAYRSLWQRWLVALGLRRSSAGGFGGVVPQPSSGHG